MKTEDIIKIALETNLLYETSMYYRINDMVDDEIVLAFANKLLFEQYSKPSETLYNYD